MVKATGTNKTTPNERKDADKDTFAKEFLVYVDDSSKVADELHERNKVAVVQEAIQRGLRPTGKVRVESEDIRDERNVLISYSVDVKPADETK
jgi:hypothetical protein